LELLIHANLGPKNQASFISDYENLKEVAASSGGRKPANIASAGHPSTQTRLGAPCLKSNVR